MNALHLQPGQQQVVGPGSNPGWVFGYVPSATEWNDWWSRKLDVAQGALVVLADTAPTNVVPGSLWFDSTNAQLYIYYSDPNGTQWVAANNANGGYALSGALTSTVQELADQVAILTARIAALEAE